MKMFNFIGIIAFCYALFLAGPEVEGVFYPVLKDFVVEGKVIENNNVTIHSRVTKVRNCQYIAPWRAKSTTGRMLQVIHEEVDGPNWSKGEVSSKIIVMGAGTEEFTLTSEHLCHPGWTVFSKLGTIK